MALPNPPQFAMECLGGPLDGNLVAWVGPRMTYQLGEVLSVYEYCERCHYHHEEDRDARTPRFIYDKEVDP